MASIDKSNDTEDFSLARISVDALGQLAAAHEATGNLAEAIRCKEMILKRMPELLRPNNAIHVNRTPAQQLFILRSRLKEVVKNLRPDNAAQSPSEFARELFRWGNKLAIQGNVNAAVHYYGMATQTDGAFASAYFNLAVALRGLQQSTPARQVCDSALKLDPSRADVWYFHALLAFESGDIAHAEAGLRKALELAPDNEDILSLSYSLYQVYLGEYRKAEPIRARLLKVSEKRIKNHPLGRSGIRMIGPNLYAMGHLAHNVDLLIKQEQLGWREPGKTVCVVPSWQVANNALLKEWGKHVPLITDPEECERLAPLVDELSMCDACSEVPGGFAHWVFGALSITQREWENQGREPLLKIESERRTEGRKKLHQALGLPENAWFVAFYARDPGFKQEGTGRYNHHRNSNIDDFTLAMRSVVERGGWVVRLGDPGMKKLPQMERVIDYAHHPSKNEELEVFLWADCRFYVSSFGGAFYSAQIFGRPCCYVDWPLVAPPIYSKNNLLLPRYLRHKGEGKILPFLVYAQPPFHYLENGGLLDSLGVEAVSNSAAEIKDAVEEMLEATQKGGEPQFKLPLAEELGFRERFQGMTDNVPLNRIASKFFEQNRAFFA